MLADQKANMIYKFINNDRSNFLHVFFKDPLWSQLPFDCVVEILKHVKTHTRLQYLNAVYAGRNNDNIFTPFIGTLPIKRNIHYKTPNYVSISTNPHVLHSTPKERKKKYNIYKKKIARTKDYSRQPNRAMRKR